MAKISEIVGVSAINTISQGTEIKGNVKASGDFRLDGTLEGSIILDGKLVVGEYGCVKGNVQCQNANIIGKVWGNVTAKELLCLHASALVNGDIVINKLSIEPGAQFIGTCKMYQEQKTPSYSTRPESIKPPVEEGKE
ncbi:MAG: polymer-forming cytoskeletal protein [Bacteroidales bacterium]|nr:polymer-forming cytoskeletal protein [Bacteroidales bacterium]